jgi:hypothetical protein
MFTSLKKESDDGKRNDLGKRSMSLMGSKKMLKLCGWNSEHNNYACWSPCYVDERNSLMNSNCKIYHSHNRRVYRVKTRA